MSEAQMTPDQIVEAMPGFLIPEKAGSTQGIIAFDLGGEGGGKWWLKIHDGKAESGKGEPPEAPKVTLAANVEDWVKIMSGKMDPVSSYMTGKLKINGDIGLAMKMQTMFRRP